MGRFLRRYLENVARCWWYWPLRTKDSSSKCSTNTILACLRRWLCRVLQSHPSRQVPKPWHVCFRWESKDCSKPNTPSDVRRHFLASSTWQVASTRHIFHCRPLGHDFACVQHHIVHRCVSSQQHSFHLSSLTFARQALGYHQALVAWLERRPGICKIQSVEHGLVRAKSKRPHQEQEITSYLFFNSLFGSFRFILFGGRGGSIFLVLLTTKWNPGGITKARIRMWDIHIHYIYIGAIGWKCATRAAIVSPELSSVSMRFGHGKAIPQIHLSPNSEFTFNSLNTCIYKTYMINVCYPYIDNYE